MSSGFSVIDPDIPTKVKTDAQRLRGRGQVQLCTTVDAWAPDALEHGLGRRCLKALLAEPGWTVRILTKNAAVAGDFDLVRQFRDRVLVGISLTGTVDVEDVIKAIEPNASPVSERMAALKEAHRLGLRTYGMLCPLLPGIADKQRQVDELVRFAKECGAEEVFAEPVNARGNGLKKTEETLKDAGFLSEAEQVASVRKRKHWSHYAASMVGNVQTSMRQHMRIDELRFLLYASHLTPEHQASILEDDAGVIWL
jgi:DNA repair photolyase